MDLRLVVLQGKPEGKEIPVRVSSFIIGRSAECHLRPNSELVSRQHCQFTIDGEVVRLRDLGSSNGTIVNGERLTEEAIINDGDLIQVGPLAFQVILQSTTAAVPVRVNATAGAAPPVAVTPVASVPAAAPAVAAAPTVAAPVAKLGSKEAKTDDIDHWLMSDAKNKVPESGSGVYSGDTQMIRVVDRSGPDTETGLNPEDTPPEGVLRRAEVPEEKMEKAGDEVQLADGRKVKVGSSKQVIEKSREDTSRAAAEIIRRMMERRPGR